MEQADVPLGPQQPLRVDAAGDPEALRDDDPHDVPRAQRPRPAPPRLPSAPPVLRGLPGVQQSPQGAHVPAAAHHARRPPPIVPKASVPQEALPPAAPAEHTESEHDYCDI